MELVKAKTSPDWKQIAQEMKKNQEDCKHKWKTVALELLITSIVKSARRRKASEH